MVGINKSYVTAQFKPVKRPGANINCPGTHLAKCDRWRSKRPGSAASSDEGASLQWAVIDKTQCGRAKDRLLRFNSHPLFFNLFRFSFIQTPSRKHKFPR
jgi:hypothetical protein